MMEIVWANIGLVVGVCIGFWIGCEYMEGKIKKECYIIRKGFSKELSRKGVKEVHVSTREP